MSSVLTKKANEYIHFSLEGKEVALPYCMSQGRWQFWRTSGKGTPNQIQREVKKTAERNGIVLSLMAPRDITAMMREYRIGVECSGFVYHVLDHYLRAEKKTSLRACTQRLPGILGRFERVFLGLNRARRVNADVLTNELNTVPVMRVRDIRPADLIRLTPLDGWKGKHVALVTEVTHDTITYVQSSRGTQEQGPHSGTITIVAPEQGLEAQEWHELTKDGKSYGKAAFRPEDGDGVKRLRCLQ